MGVGFLLFPWFSSASSRRWTPQEKTALEHQIVVTKPGIAPPFISSLLDASWPRDDRLVYDF